MERASHQPCLDKGLALPEGIPNVADFAIDADADLLLGGGHDLCLHPTDLAYDSGEILFWRTLHKMVALEPEGVHLSPGQLCGGVGMLGLQLLSRRVCGRG